MPLAGHETVHSEGGEQLTPESMEVATGTHHDRIWHGMLSTPVSVAEEAKAKHYTRRRPRDYLHLLLYSRFLPCSSAKAPKRPFEMLSSQVKDMPSMRQNSRRPKSLPNRFAVVVRLP